MADEKKSKPLPEVMFFRQQLSEWDEEHLTVARETLDEAAADREAGTVEVGEYRLVKKHRVRSEVRVIDTVEMC